MLDSLGVETWEGGDTCEGGWNGGCVLHVGHRGVVDLHVGTFCIQGFEHFVFRVFEILRFPFFFSFVCIVFPNPLRFRKCCIYGSEYFAFRVRNMLHVLFLSLVFLLGWRKEGWKGMGG